MILPQCCLARTPLLCANCLSLQSKTACTHVHPSPPPPPLARLCRLLLQVVSSELASLHASHSGLQEAAAALRQQLAGAEQAVRLKEVELEDVRGAYEGLATEHRRLQSSVMQVGWGQQAAAGRQL